MILKVGEKSILLQAKIWENMKPSSLNYILIKIKVDGK